MSPAIVTMRFPKGTLPASGYRCATCGLDVVGADETQRAFDEARGLGLFGVQNAKRRKLTTVGTSLGVTLDKELREALGVVKGDDLEVGLQGDAIVIRKA